MRAMPGRLMSLIVMGTRDSSPLVSTSSERISRCCSKSCSMVICVVLIELKQSHPPILQAIGDPRASAVRLGEDQHREPALEQHPDGLILGHRARLRLRADDLGPVPPLRRRVTRQRRRDVLLARRPRVLLLVVLELLLAPLQRALL